MRRIRRRNRCVAFVALLVSFWTGCGTIYSRRSEGLFPEACRPTPWLPRVYSGAVFDFWALADPVGALLVLDIPFSVAADTVLLPLTVYEQARHGSFSKECP